jgi:hypothetical protein
MLDLGESVILLITGEEVFEWSLVLLYLSVTSLMPLVIRAAITMVD